MLLFLSVILDITILTVTVFLLVLVFSVSFISRFVAIPLRTSTVKFSLVVEVSVVNLSYEFDYSLQYLKSIEFIDFVDNILFKAIIEEYN